MPEWDWGGDWNLLKQIVIYLIKSVQHVWKGVKLLGGGGGGKNEYSYINCSVCFLAVKHIVDNHRCALWQVVLEFLVAANFVPLLTKWENFVSWCLRPSSKGTVLYQMKYQCNQGQRPLLVFAHTLINYLPNALLPWESVCTTVDSVEPVKIKVDLPEICNWLTENPGEYTSLFHAFFVLAIAAWLICYRYFQTGLCWFDVLQWKSGTIWMVARLRLKKLCPRMTWVSWNCSVFCL